MNRIKLERIGAQILRELSQIIHEEAKNEALQSITITAVDVANDLGSAKVYYTFFGTYERDFIETELKNASSFLRTELAERIDIRHTPELRFVFDQSIEYGTNIERILEEVNSK